MKKAEVISISDIWILLALSISVPADLNFFLISVAHFSSFYLMKPQFIDIKK